MAVPSATTVNEYVMERQVRGAEWYKYRGSCDWHERRLRLMEEQVLPGRLDQDVLSILLFLS